MNNMQKAFKKKGACGLADGGRPNPNMLGMGLAAGAGLALGGRGRRQIEGALEDAPAPRPAPAPVLAASSGRGSLSGIRDGAVPPHMRRGLADGGGVGEYWANDNRQFEATNPSTLGRVWRSLNPLTGFGSALGSMHTAAGNGDKTGMALSAAEALPLFGALKTVAVAGKGLAKQGVKQVTDWRKSAALTGATAGASLVNDAYGNSQEPGLADGGATKRKPNGGEVEGPGGPTDDEAGEYALSDDEYVLPADTVEAMGGAEALDEIRNATHEFVDEGNRPGLANGGLGGAYDWLKGKASSGLQAGRDALSSMRGQPATAQTGAPAAPKINPKTSAGGFTNAERMGAAAKANAAGSPETAARGATPRDGFRPRDPRTPGTGRFEKESAARKARAAAYANRPPPVSPAAPVAGGMAQTPTKFNAGKPIKGLGALGFGASAYDAAKNGLDVTNTAGMITGASVLPYAQRLPGMGTVRALATNPLTLGAMALTHSGEVGAGSDIVPGAPESPKRPLTPEQAQQLRKNPQLTYEQLTGAASPVDSAQTRDAYVPGAGLPSAEQIASDRARIAASSLPQGIRGAQGNLSTDRLNDSRRVADSDALQREQAGRAAGGFNEVQNRVGQTEVLPGGMKVTSLGYKDPEAARAWHERQAASEFSPEMVEIVNKGIRARQNTPSSVAADNARFAADGYGDVTKSVGADGRVTYGDSSPNPFLGSRFSNGQTGQQNLDTRRANDVANLREGLARAARTRDSLDEMVQDRVARDTGFARGPAAEAAIRLEQSKVAGATRTGLAKAQADTLKAQQDQRNSDRTFDLAQSTERRAQGKYQQEKNTAVLEGQLGKQFDKDGKLSPVWKNFQAKVIATAHSEGKSIDQLDEPTMRRYAVLAGLDEKTQPGAIRSMLNWVFGNRMPETDDLTLLQPDLSVDPDKDWMGNPTYTAMGGQKRFTTGEDLTREELEAIAALKGRN